VKTLDEIALAYGTDKASHSHGYTRHYARYFEPIRNGPVKLLELGWGGHEDPAEGGRSAQTWRDYFPAGTVVVVDVEPKALTEAHDGIVFRQGSQGDAKFLNELAAEFGPFDIVIDDASHLSSLTIASWRILWPHLKPGGIYVVEDTHMAYHEFYYGKGEANADPDKPRKDGSPTAMQWLRRMADEVNFKGRDEWDLFPPKYHLGYRLESIEFLFNIAFARKAFA
jgi:8-demethyl-8-(2-methoxy-alpha-L-rhamnosyl)tetracenomycin-C 3'-O-methyltransferase